MTKIVVHIGRLVVHGHGGFATEAFTDNLKEEIARRIGQGLSAQDIADRLQGGAASLQHHATTVAPARASRGGSSSRSAEGMAPSALAGRLVK